METVLPTRKKRIIIALLLLLVILAIAGVYFFVFRRAQTFQNNGSTDASGEWQLIWSDEFNGDHLDDAVWTQEVREDGWYNNELQYYTDNEENISFRDGALVITARFDPDGGKRMYTSARISTKNKIHVQYGRIEAKLKLPQGQGIWPAFWMLGTANKGQWPGCGEIDIMEAVNDAEFCYGTLHWKREKEDDPYAARSKGSKIPLDNPGQWHIYALEWTQNEMKWYLDDTCYYTFQFDESDQYQMAFQEPAYLLLNLAVGGNFPGEVDNSIFPKEYCVDYVRVYTWTQGT